MKFKPSDEFAHEPTAEPGWQENYVWHAWDPIRRSGFYFHLGHIPADGLIDVRAVVIVDGVVTSAVTQSAGTDCLAAPGLDANFIIPFEHVKMRYEGLGAQGHNDAGWYGLLKGILPFGFEVEFFSDHPPIAWSSFFKDAGWGRVDASDAILPGQTEPLAGVDPGDHYDLGGRWKGRVWSGDKSVDCEGLLVRDHTWGPRGWSIREGYWLPTVLDGGKTLISTGMALKDDWTGFSVKADASGIVDVVPDVFVRTAGPPVPRQFEFADVLRVGDGVLERYRFHVGIHLPLTRHGSFLDSDEQWGWSHAYSTVQGEGTTGFGILCVVPNETQVRQGLSNPMPAFA